MEPGAWHDRPWFRVLRGGRGRPFGAVLLLVLLVVPLLPEQPTLAPLAVLRDLRLGAFDAYHALAPRVRTSAPAVVVEIDERSLARHGQWPWPRTLVARLVDRIAAAGPAAIGVDIVMPEPDRLSPSRLAALIPDVPVDLATRLGHMPSNDAVLALAFRDRPVILGLAGVPTPEPAGTAPARRTPIRLVGGPTPPALRRYASALRSVDELHAAASGYGLLNPDADRAVVRRMPLVAASGDAVLPALAVEMLRVAVGQPAVTVRVHAGEVDAVSVGDLTVPTRPDGTVWLHFTRHDPARFVSAADVLADAVEPDRLAHRLVLLGVTAIGLGDHHVTPVDPRMPGVEIHAQLLEGIFDGALLSRPPWTPWAEAGLVLLGGLALILAVPARRVWVSVTVFAVAVALIVGAGFGLYRRAGILLDAATPALGLVVVFSAMLGVTLAEADTQRRVLRRQVQQEREAAARVAGELEAARRIQMGILPDARRAFPGEPRFELYAFLEPARLVGGDLYDFFRLGSERLFFLIGDVSGKGLPGALFMAVSKALCKSAALRSAGDLGAALREANAEIARDNPETMFVTVSAGLLDVVTGRLEYVNAGHEAPYRLGADGRLRDQLDEGGGPPLAVLEEYPYAAVSCQLERGETLVLVTDGLAEARDPRGELYGRARLEAVLTGLAPAGAAGTAAAVGEALRVDVSRWVAGAEPADDLAILILRWAGP